LCRFVEALYRLYEPLHLPCTTTLNINLHFSVVVHGNFDTIFAISHQLQI